MSEALRFGAIGLDHRHIYHLIGENMAAGAECVGYCPRSSDEKVVDVQYTDRRYLRKPKGSPAGFVIVDREKVLVLRVEQEILRALLEREEL